MDVQEELLRQAKKKRIPLHRPWRELTETQRAWVIDGEGRWADGVWFGVAGFFRWLESKAYKMHVRVLLSKYRSYTTCEACDGARLKPNALWWYLTAHVNGRSEGKDMHHRMNVHDVMTMPLSECQIFFQDLVLPKQFDEPAQLLLSEIHTRINYLIEVGLGYLTLDRQARTLSGGEVQRINLTTALGASLVNTLFVLDEPSIGLHPRDIQRLIGVLHRLRDAGNTLLVVEHDPQVILSADKVVDVGPGPGRQGGKIEFFGTPKALLRYRRSVTADYLSGRRQVKLLGSEFVDTSIDQRPFLRLLGAAAHNLKKIDISLPLRQLVCITGVSGSGKSTLMRSIIYPALCQRKGKFIEQPGAYSALEGHEHIADVVLVDQSPIGKTTRSTPATYVGAFDAIRKRFVTTPMAKERGYTTGTFSFNSGNGRCPTCAGNGFEQVEMQFLSDVYLRCTECDGSRYRSEILEVRVLAECDSVQKAVSIADVLTMTVTEAIELFSDDVAVISALQPLVDVGLEYLELGQPVPTLSGGESQRLKLAGHLAESARSQKKRLVKNRVSETREQQTTALNPSTSCAQGMLFLFDEPTTGLHFSDIAVLMDAFQQLISRGHSLIVIEHNLDVIRSADWIIDIGPEGGAAGGEIVATGSPAQLRANASTHTARALQAYEQSEHKQKESARGTATNSALVGQKKRARSKSLIEIHHAREHNLKNLDVSIPRQQLTVITGVSGSGKSTVAFDLLFAEGQRRYLESLNAYARQFIQSAPRPDVDAIHGIPPTVAIEQRTSRGGRKSTTATLTEIYHFMRLLYVKLGKQYCPDCNILIEPQSVEMIFANVLKQFKRSRINVLAPMVVSRKGIYKELAQWAAHKGYAQLRVDGAYELTDPWPVLDRYKEHDIELPVGNIKVTAQSENELFSLLNHALDLGNGVLIIETPTNKKQEIRYSIHRACADCGCGFDELDPRLFSYNSKHGWCQSCYGTGEMNVEFDEDQTGEEAQWIYGEAERANCTVCDGQRLNSMALSVRFRDYSIAQLAAMSFQQAQHFFGKLKLLNHEQAIARDLLLELNSRLSFLNQVGLGYLTMNRAAPTLSGGEAQRIRLAAQLGSNLQGVCYILDEPTIGLHARDNEKLIATLRQLQKQGNTVVVVEHDEETIREADYLIDIGPGAGINGGEVVASGSLTRVMRNKQSVTGQMLANPMRHPLPNLRDLERRALYQPAQIKIIDADENNLRDVTVSIPLQQLVTVSGVSGSGKSTLIRGVLEKNLINVMAYKRKRGIGKESRNQKGSPMKRFIWQGCRAIEGWELIDRVLEVDQTPIGKTSRSCPATYIGIWDQIRKLFAGTVDARLRGYTAARFSFNTGDGRCASCGGHGMKKIEMNFLPDVRVECEMCHGWRFNDETLAIHYKYKHIGQVLAMSVDEAAEYFSSIPKVHKALKLLQDVGLGYLTLGQQSPTLSGGEAQRIKLVAELSKAALDSEGVIQKTLYLLDEPTVGLHMADVDKLIAVLHRLVDAGNSVMVVEHNLDFIAESDWVIDMGPEGGMQGGRVVAQGNPSTLIKRKRSVTGAYLKDLLTG